MSIAGLRRAAIACGALLACLPARALLAQDGPVRVFLDCPETECDLDYFRRAVSFVDYVRLPADAQVHILVTEQDTGGGGEAFTAIFIGRGTFAARRDTLRFFAPRDATDDARRSGIAQVVRLGLVAFAAHSPAAPHLRISFDRPEGVAVGPVPTSDPWDFWVFRVSGSGYVEGESQFSEVELFGGVSAHRTTPELKLGLAVEGNYERERFELDSVTTVTSTQQEYGISAFAVRSLGPHWGARAAAAVDRASTSNRKLGIRTAAGLEYNVFPYLESATRLFTVRYEVGVHRFVYDEETIFDRTAETLVDHELEVTFDAIQPWGSAGIGAQGRQHFIDLSSHSLELFGDVEIRLLRGLSLELDGSVSRIRDQRQLPAGGLTPEEILLRQQELATDYRYYISAGLSYSFGSIFNNVINRRFGDGDAFF